MKRLNGEWIMWEPPVCSVAPAIGNAVYCATGVSLNRLPMDPQELYKAFCEAGVIDDSVAAQKTSKASGNQLPH